MTDTDSATLDSYLDFSDLEELHWRRKEKMEEHRLVKVPHRDGAVRQCREQSTMHCVVEDSFDTKCEDR